MEQTTHANNTQSAAKTRDLLIVGIVGRLRSA